MLKPFIFNLILFVYKKIKIEMEENTSITEEFSDAVDNIPGRL